MDHVLSRNAIIGLIHRAGGRRRDHAIRDTLAYRAPQARKPKPPKPTAAAPSAPRPRPVLVFDATPPLPGGYALPEPHQCKWPFGDPQKPGFRFCTAHRMVDDDDNEAPYCEKHESMAHAPGHVKRRTAQRDSKMLRLAARFG